MCWTAPSWTSARSVGVRRPRERRTDSIVPEALGRTVRELVQAHITGLTERFSANRIDYTLVNTSAPLDHALFSYLSTRERLMRTR